MQRSHLRIALPKRTLEEKVDELIAKAGIELYQKHSRALKYLTNRPEIEWIIKLNAQDIPAFLTCGIVDLGITGEDQLMEFSARAQITQAQQPENRRSFGPLTPILSPLPPQFNWQSLLRLPLSKSSSKPVYISLVAKAENVEGGYVFPWLLPSHSVIASEYPGITEKYFTEMKLGLSLGPSQRTQIATYHFLHTYGTTEILVVEDIAQGAVETIETGETLKRNGLRIIDVILESYPVVVISPAAQVNPSLKPAIDWFVTAIRKAVPRKIRHLTKPKAPGELWLSPFMRESMGMEEISLPKSRRGSPIRNVVT